MGSRSKAMMLADFAAWMMDERGYTRATRMGYSEKVQHVDKLLARLNTNVATASFKNLHRVVLADLPPDAATRNAYRSALVAFYAFLDDRGVRHDNPAKQLPRLRERKGLPRPLGAQEVKRYWAAARRLGGKFALIAALGLYAGLRVSEMAGLEWADVSEAGIYVQGKGRKERLVPMATAVASALAVWRAECKSPRWVFPSPYRDTHVDRRRILDWHHRILFLAVVPQTGVHRLRHTFATEALDVSNNIAAVAELLGHSSVATTSIYAKVKQERLRDIMQHLYAERGNDV